MDKRHQELISRIRTARERTFLDDDASLGLPRTYDMLAHLGNRVLKSEQYLEDPGILDFRKQLLVFMNIDSELGSWEQQDFMKVFWDKLGYEVPNPSSAMQSDLDNFIVKNPNQRIIPTPLLDLNGRKELANNGQKLFRNKYNHSDKLLWTPDETSLYSKLLSNPNQTISNENSTYEVLYKTDSLELLGRSQYIDYLVNTKRVTIDQSGMAWSFPIMDIRASDNLQNESVRTIYEQANTILTPEALIVTHIINQASGIHLQDYVIDLANEAIYSTNKDQQTRSMNLVTGVYWDPDYYQINLCYWNPDDHCSNTRIQTLTDASL